MTTTTTTCDRCHDVAELGRLKLTVIAGEFKAGSVDQATGRGCVDLCAACAQALAVWLMTRLAAS
jgi:hypothetical protein